MEELKRHLAQLLQGMTKEKIVQLLEILESVKYEPEEDGGEGRGSAKKPRLSQSPDPIPVSLSPQLNGVYSFRLKGKTYINTNYKNPDSRYLEEK